MKTFGISLEVSLRILTFNADNEFLFKQSKRIQQSTEGKIEFSLLLDIKQSSPVSNEQISVELIHIIDEASSDDSKPEREQNIKMLNLGTINLAHSTDSTSLTTPLQFLSNPWPIKQLIKWNCKNVPTDGSGSYAIVARIPSEGAPEKKDILDCLHFEVI